jgi:putative transposase
MSSGIFNKYTGYHNRKSIRLRGYDYSQPGYYFITICIHDRTQRLFGNVKDGKMALNEMGNIAYNQFECLPERFTNVKLDAFQIMPNHIHAIIPVHAISGRCISVGATLAVALDTDAVAPNVHAVGHESIDRQNPAIQNNVNTFRAGASPAPTKNTKTISKNIKMKSGNTKTTTGNMKNITIADIVGAYKSLVSNECLKIYKLKNQHMGKLWQRNYYEHIIRDEKSLFFIRNYIRENTLNWSDDSENHIDREIHEFEMNEIVGAQ